MAETIGVFDAKARFSELVERAERGEEIVVTRHGRPVARVAPLAKAQRTPEETADMITRAQALRERIRAGGGATAQTEIQSWKEAGRR